MSIESTDDPYNILVVDDEPDIHTVLKMSLKNEKVQDRELNIYSAHSKKEALEFMYDTDKEISLIFLDVIMESDHAGFDFLTELRASTIHPQPQVVLMTGQAGLHSERDAAQYHEINSYLSKADLSHYRLLSLLNTSIRNFETIKKLELTTKNLEQLQFKQAQHHKYVQSVFDALSDALIVVNDRGIIESVNKAVNGIFGYVEEEIVGKNVSILMPEPFASKHNQYMFNYEQTGKANIIGIGRELPAIKKNGSTFPMELTVTQMELSGNKLYIGLIRNISDRKHAEQEIYQLAFFDSTTNLPNLDSFYKNIEHEVSSKLPTDDLVTLALVDLSGFYRINQAYGHEVGDELLSLLVDRMEWVLPKGIRLYRADGTDFIIQTNSKTLSKEQHAEQITSIIKELLETIGQDIFLGSAQHKISAHVGIMTEAATNIDIGRIIHQLEFASAHSKLDSEQRFAFYNAELEQQDLQRFRLGQELNKSIERGELTLHLQPQFSKSRIIVCSEALIRWNSTNLGFVSPAEFIPVAESNGFIVKLGKWVLENVCRLLQDANQKGVNTNIAINVSAREMLQPNFVANVQDCINKYDIQARQLTFEITESVFATDIESVIKSMDALHEVGLRFSIDDFGTGYSSLSYLKRLPIDELKIDKSFVDDITEQETKVPLVETIITMASSFDLDIVAEGVEHEYQFDYLSERPKMLLQGYLLSKPLPIREWQQLLGINKTP